MTPVLSPLIDLRNEIIHSGLSELPFEQQMQLYDGTQGIVQEYILRLLGYHGLFHDYAEMTWRKIP